MLAASVGLKLTSIWNGIRDLCSDQWRWWSSWGGDGGGCGGGDDDGDHHYGGDGCSGGDGDHHGGGDGDYCIRHNDWRAATVIVAI